jgi:hypothetical protein
MNTYAVLAVTGNCNTRNDQDMFILHNVVDVVWYSHAPYKIPKAVTFLPLPSTAPPPQKKEKKNMIKVRSDKPVSRKKKSFGKLTVW